MLASARLHFVHRSGLDEWRELSMLGALGERARKIDCDEAKLLDEEPETRKRGQAGARYAALPSAAARPRSYAAWSKRLASHCYREQTMRLWKAPALKLTSEPGEDQRHFRVPVREARRARRGASRIGREAQDVERAQAEVAEQQRKLLALEAEHQDAVADLEADYSGEVEVEAIQVRPRKADISAESIALAWTPWRIDEQGIAEPAWEP